jgi:hypothetical protein
VPVRTAWENRDTVARQGLKFWVSAWLPVAVGIGVIMLESTELMGSDHTNHPLRWLWESIFGPVANARWMCFIA